MKKIFPILLLSFLYSPINAQWNTNTSGQVTTNDKVGIGTTSPSSELEVKSVFGNDSEVHINAGSDGYPSVIRFQDAGQNTWGFLSNRPSTGAFSLYNYQVGASAIVLDENSRVGIGTTSPSTLLHLKGDLGSNFIRIENARTGLSLGDNIGAIQFYSNDDTDNTPAVAASINATAGPSGGEGRLEFRTRLSSEGAFPTTSMIILNNGNVGVGTTTPETKLEVYEPVGGISNFITVGAASYQSMRIGVDDAGARFQSVSSTQPLYFMTNGAERMRVQSDGNVGIGTTSPSTLLHLKGAMDSNFIRMENAATGLSLGDNIGAIQFYSNDDTDNTPAVAASINATAGPSGGEGRLEFRTRLSSEGAFPTTSMIILNNGNVGIGTTTPGEKLEVNGTIRSKKVKVEASGWPDFVFEKEYKLRTLEEVENYISKNKHLPEIPSEPEVAENGINLGEMDAKLLQKIEELTLYLIEQNKQNQAQQAEIETLKAKISKLENE